MILICGIPTEDPCSRVREEIESLSVPHLFFNQRKFEQSHIAYTIHEGDIRGELMVEGRSYRLEFVDGAYVRLMDDRDLPELENEPLESLKRRSCRALHDTLYKWLEITPARVVNRIAAMGSNSSKPYQAQMIRRAGLLVPETLITNDPDLVLQFYRRHNGRVIYKSISGVRSIAKLLADEDFERLGDLRACPAQFQQFIGGTDVRVHTVGPRAFATRIRSDDTDYRYSESSRLETYELPDELRQRCTRLANRMGLAFAGIDLKLTEDGSVYCFEVNPCPAFSFFESHTGQPIARAVAEYLAGLDGTAADPRWRSRARLAVTG